MDGIGKSSLAREAIASAIRAQADRAASLREIASGITGESRPATEAPKTDFSNHLSGGIEAVDTELKNAASMPEKLVTGQVDDFYEVAVQVRQADLTFKFAMEIRNKLIDAYREVMRMTV